MSLYFVGAVASNPPSFVYPCARMLCGLPYPPPPHTSLFHRFHDSLARFHTRTYTHDRRVHLHTDMSTFPCILPSCLSPFSFSRFGFRCWLKSASASHDRDGGTPGMRRTGIRGTLHGSFLCLALSSFRSPFPSLDDHRLSISVCVCVGAVHPSVYVYASKATHLTHHRISLPLLLPFPGLLPSFYTLQTRLPSTSAYTVQQGLLLPTHPLSCIPLCVCVCGRGAYARVYLLTSVGVCMRACAHLSLSVCAPLSLPGLFFQLSIAPPSHPLFCCGSPLKVWKKRFASLVVLVVVSRSGLSRFSFQTVKSIVMSHSLHLSLCACVCARECR